ncbi:uridine diphosphate glucose pyrophosphatase NUDT14-like isoform X4 [Macrosteles quadrilineatus]|uniref:uridine diphosphate glucose pyrophosphatase NUDT14-like isoform X3 n=1 Tax=Macrosteles quadrilineatus TaxID=74068 RepID=UPI0023E3088B|nr:uridine diphosphate glucose pyrophosphatase NUDT14-like isoform X3 [Macrosteles quadrilineatus]XP_054258066.1 uridine diphosphate glucose pyrophosphatase NUDT14-like isoform X4 [Macrosteles quadrilineatus]
MFNISNVSVSKTVESKYVKPLSIDYTQNGVKKRWDLIQTHSSVSIIIFNTSRKVLVFVKQFRPAVWYNSIPFQDRSNPIDTEKYPASLGITLELCAGIIDKDKSIEEIAREEVLEECGYDVPLKNLKQIKKYRGAVGFAGEQQTLFYAEVTDDMKVGGGGGLAEEGEFIEVVEMGLLETKQLLDSGDLENSPPEFLFALMWLFCHIIPNV